MLGRLKRWARSIRRDVYALWLAARDPRVPWHAKAVAAFVVAYALSPIDLIPDFVPVLGYLDDLLLVPAGIALAVWMVPAPLMAEHRARAETLGIRPVSRVGAAIVAAVWATAFAASAWLLFRWYGAG